MSVQMNTHQRNAWRSGPSYRMFVEIDHPSGILRYIDGQGSMEIDGNLWLALGHAGTINGLDTQRELSQSEVTLVMSFIPGNLNINPNVDISNRIASIYIGILTPFGELLDGLIKVTDIILSNQVNDNNGNTSTISLIGNNGVVNLGTQTDSKVSTSFQNFVYPESGGRGLSQIPLLRKKFTSWVSASYRDPNRS